METTRHFTATTYVVADGATALHRHDRIGKWLPPGGHVDRGELPHEAALREVEEEIGLEPTLVAEQDDVASPTVRSLPQPHHVQLADVNIYGGAGSAGTGGDPDGSSEVGHQHVDMIYYAAAEEQRIDPAPGEAPADAWEWFGRADLESNEDLDTDVVEIGQRAIETVTEWRVED